MVWPRGHVVLINDRLVALKSLSGRAPRTLWISRLSHWGTTRYAT